VTEFAKLFADKVADVSCAAGPEKEQSVPWVVPQSSSDKKPGTDP